MGYWQLFLWNIIIRGSELCSLAICLLRTHSTIDWSWPSAMIDHCLDFLKSKCHVFLALPIYHPYLDIPSLLLWLLSSHWIIGIHSTSSRVLVGAPVTARDSMFLSFLVWHSAWFWNDKSSNCNTSVAGVPSNLCH